MNKKIFVLFAFSFLFYLGFVSASTNGTFIGNSTNTITNTSAEFDVVAEVQATQYYAEAWLNTSEIDFGPVTPGKSSDLYRQKYKIKARGNINVEIFPSLESANDKIFSNLYFARTYTSGWKKLGDYSLKFNLTENEGYWSTIESGGLENATSINGVQSIKLDLSEYNEVIPFTMENYRNTVKFIVIPAWNSVSDPSP